MSYVKGQQQPMLPIDKQTMRKGGSRKIKKRKLPSWTTANTSMLLFGFFFLFLMCVCGWLTWKTRVAWGAGRRQRAPRAARVHKPGEARTCQPQNCKPCLSQKQTKGRFRNKESQPRLRRTFRERGLALSPPPGAPRRRHGDVTAEAPWRP